MKKAKWLIYTVAVGLIPFAIRFIIYLFDKDAVVDYVLNPVDFVIFGLVLSLSNINEIDSKEYLDNVWKTTRIGISVLFIILFSAVLMFVTYADYRKDESFDYKSASYTCLILAVSAFVFSYGIFTRVKSSE